MTKSMTSPHNTLIKPAIEYLYSVFGHYHSPDKPTYCSCCVNSEEDRLLRSKPLRELSTDELARYSWKAITTWGTTEQFKYLLPRLFETVVLDNYRHDPGIVQEAATDWFLTRDFSLAFDIAIKATPSSDLLDELSRAIARRSEEG